MCEHSHSAGDSTRLANCNSETFVKQRQIYLQQLDRKTGKAIQYNEHILHHPPMWTIALFLFLAISNMPACAAFFLSTAAEMITRRSSSDAPWRIASLRLTSLAPNRQTCNPTTTAICFACFANACRMYCRTSCNSDNTLHDGFEACRPENAAILPADRYSI